MTYYETKAIVSVLISQILTLFIVTEPIAPKYSIYSVFGFVYGMGTFAFVMFFIFGKLTKKFLYFLPMNIFIPIILVSSLHGSYFNPYQLNVIFVSSTLFVMLQLISYLIWTNKSDDSYLSVVNERLNGNDTSESRSIVV